MQGRRSTVDQFPDPYGFEPVGNNPDPFSSIWIPPNSDPLSSIWTDQDSFSSLDPESFSLSTPIPNPVNPSSTQSTQNSLNGFGLEEDNETRPVNMERTRLACKRKNIEIGSTSNSNGASSSSSSSNPNPNLDGANLLPVPVNYMSVPGLNERVDDPFPGFVPLAQNGNIGTSTGTSSGNGGTGVSSQRSFRIRTGPVLHNNHDTNNSNNVTNDNLFMNNNDNDHDDLRHFSLWGLPNNPNNNDLANNNATPQHHFLNLPLPLVHRFPRNSRTGPSNGAGTSAASPIDLESGFISDFLTPMGNNNRLARNEERERQVRAGPSNSASSLGGLPPGLAPTWNNPPSRYHHRNISEEMGAGRLGGPPMLRGHHHHHHHHQHQHHHQGPPRLRPAFLLDRSSSSGDAGWGVPLSLRSREGRRIIEIRNALELMRRGDNLRFESLYYGGIEMQDRHRDMRLDIDNMSYEDLLALEERIGSVNTGLNEESIKKLLKQYKFSSFNLDVSTNHEPCCICQEEYVEGDELGRLDCGHDFHSTCVRKWLLQKNLCPICKNTGLIT